MNNPEEAVRTADELEAFFHVSLYMGLRYMLHNCNNVQMTMHDHFDDYKYAPSRNRYFCGTDKYYSMLGGRLWDVNHKTYHFLDDDGKPGNHPIGEIFAVMLKWFKKRYEALEQVPANTESLPLDDHTALLQLLDSKLDDPPPGEKATIWPEKDKVEDQLKPTKKHGRDSDDKALRAKRVKTKESRKGGARAFRSRKASGSSGAVARVPPSRTRGSRLKA